MPRRKTVTLGPATTATSSAASSDGETSSVKGETSTSSVFQAAGLQGQSVPLSQSATEQRQNELLTAQEVPPYTPSPAPTSTPALQVPSAVDAWMDQVNRHGADSLFGNFVEAMGGTDGASSRGSSLNGSPPRRPRGRPRRNPLEIPTPRAAPAPVLRSAGAPSRPTYGGAFADDKDRETRVHLANSLNLYREKFTGRIQFAFHPNYTAEMSREYLEGEMYAAEKACNAVGVDRVLPALLMGIASASHEACVLMHIDALTGPKITLPQAMQMLLESGELKDEMDELNIKLQKHLSLNVYARTLIKIGRGLTKVAEINTQARREQFHAANPPPPPPAGL